MDSRKWNEDGAGGQDGPQDGGTGNQDPGNAQELAARMTALQAELKMVRQEAAGKRHALKDVMSKLGVANLEELDTFAATRKAEKDKAMTAEQRLAQVETELTKAQDRMATYRDIAKDQAIGSLGLLFSGRSMDPALTLKVLAHEPDLKIEEEDAEGRPRFTAKWIEGGKPLDAEAMQDAFFKKYPALEKSTRKSSGTDNGDGDNKTGLGRLGMKPDKADSRRQYGLT